MNRLKFECRGGEIHYLAPMIERLEIAPERGFAGTGGDIDDMGSEDW